MKKSTILFFIGLLLITVTAANAQEFKKFRVGVGAGYAIPGGNGAKGGVLFTIEPSYRISDQILLGLRWESAALIRGYSESVPDGIDLNIAAIGSFAASGQYYFSNEGFRPFVGAGLGLFTLAAIKYDDGSGSGTTTIGTSESKFGFFPRVGFDAGHFTLAIDYNIIPATKIDGDDGSFKNSYIGIRVGGFFGGGKK